MAFMGRSVDSLRTLPWGRRLSAGLVTALVLGWSLKLLAGLLVTHTAASCEWPAVFAAVVGVGAGALSVALLAARRRHVIVRVAALALWVVLAIGGIFGSVEHLAGGSPGYGPVDQRPRPPLAPLVFTGLGVAGAAALLLGGREPRTEASR